MHKEVLAQTKFHTGMRFGALLAAALLTVGLSACSTSGNDGEGKSDTNVKVIQLGAILPLTGGNAQNGRDSLRGAQLAIDKINAAGGIKSMGGAKLEIKSTDATSDPAKAASAATQCLSKNERPLAIIGAYATGLTTTVARVTERAKVPLFSTSFGDALSEQGYKYYFQIPAVTSVMGKAQMKFAIEMSQANDIPMNNVAIVYANNAYGASQGEALKKQAEAEGKKIVLFEGYDPAITDAGPIASKIMASKPDGIFSIAYVNDGVLLLRALNAQGNKAPIFGGTGGFVVPDFPKALGEKVNGVFSVTNNDPAGYGELGKEYEKKYGEFMVVEANMCAAAVDIIAQALEEHPTTDPTEFAKYLHEGTFDQGAAAQQPGGAVKFNDQGRNVNASAVEVQWQNQELVGVWPSDIVTGKPLWTSK